MSAINTEPESDNGVPIGTTQPGSDNGVPIGTTQPGSGNGEPIESTEPDEQMTEDPEIASVPIFYDEKRRRWPWFSRIAILALCVVAISVLMLIISLIALPLMPPMRLPKALIKIESSKTDPSLDRLHRQIGAVESREETRLEKLEEKSIADHKRRDRNAAAFLANNARHNVEAAAPGKPAPVPMNPSPVVAGFYVNWDESSRASVHRNIDALTHVIPEWLHLQPYGFDYTGRNSQAVPFVDRQRENIYNQDLTSFVRSHNVAMIPLLNNYTRPEGGGTEDSRWDARVVHAVSATPIARAHTVFAILGWLQHEQMQGINIDFEEVASEDRDNLVLFMKDLYNALHPRGLIVTQDVQIDNDAFDLPRLARWTDWLVPMIYDQHGSNSTPGPIAGIPWTRDAMRRLVKQIPPAKLVMGVSNHAYDWSEASKTADDMTYQGAVVIARESQPDAQIHLDPAALNPTYTYSDMGQDATGAQREVDHTVWMQDAVSVYNQLTIARPFGIRGGALWFMGAEDPTLWSFYDHKLWNSDWGALVDRGILNIITYGGQAQVDFEGSGELLQPIARPTNGLRTVVRDPQTGLITAESYLKDAKGMPRLPTSYIVRRYGGADGNPNKLAVLTFDDGPDPKWTPTILNILKQYKVPATFFDIGSEVEAFPDIVRREWNEGHLIGNHSFYHPDLFKVSAERQELELTTTQRVIQAVTGHSTLLFRPPFGGDTEPQTGAEVEPLSRAADMNYITVGETNDPQDWRPNFTKPGTLAQDFSRPRTEQDIVNDVLQAADEGAVILLHDGGGDRAMTIEALPQIIMKLRARGYRFTSVAELAGISRDRLMPAITDREKLLVGADRFIFEVTYETQRVLTTLFLLSIIMGVSRVLFLLVLALLQRVRERKVTFTDTYQPLVSVIIAAYNEQKVIAATVEALLKSTYRNLEIIVVDDGSTDGTYETAVAAFSDTPNIKLLRKANGGKASALNRGLKEAKGEILVALDADTLFTPTTIGNLVRHFADPNVGAVSGNVQVGNTNNLLTRWQALEYITSQNFDRRAYDLLNCITVVPGAVGALRREAVMNVGGYTSDTLAEDTDLTWKLRRAGWRISNDNDALAFTEAPETLRNLAKQRFRWAFGTLQCLWKHSGALGQHGAFGWVAMPSLWLYQIFFPAVSPFMDIAMVWSLFAGNFLQLGRFYVGMFLVELTAAAIAVKLGKGNPRLLPWLFFQRFVYRQLMYYVIIKSVFAAIRGGAVGWSKFERTGTAKINTKSA